MDWKNCIHSSSNQQKTHELNMPGDYSCDEDVQFETAWWDFWRYISSNIKFQFSCFGGEIRWCFCRNFKKLLLCQLLQEFPPGSPAAGAPWIRCRHWSQPGRGCHRRHWPSSRTAFDEVRHLARDVLLQSWSGPFWKAVQVLVMICSMEQMTFSSPAHQRPPWRSLKTPFHSHWLHQGLPLMHCLPSFLWLLSLPIHQTPNFHQLHQPQPQRRQPPTLYAQKSESNRVNIAYFF